jgi:hypothetical protein
MMLQFQVSEASDKTASSFSHGASHHKRTPFNRPLATLAKLLHPPPVCLPYR